MCSIYSGKVVCDNPYVPVSGYDDSFGSDFYPV